MKSLLRHRSDRPKLTDRSFDLEIHRRCFAAVFFDLILNLLPLVERAGLSTLNEGQHIEYEIEENRGKTSAVNLKVK